MIGDRKCQEPLFIIPGSLRDLIPDDHLLKQVDAILDLSWLRPLVAHTYCRDNGRPSIPPESVLRLMLAGFLLGIVHDRRLVREAQVNLAIRWFAGYDLHEALPEHSTLTIIRQRWGADRFKQVLQRSVAQCVQAGLVGGEAGHLDATLIRADVSWESLVAVYVERSLAENPLPPEPAGGPATAAAADAAVDEGGKKKRSTTDPDASMATSCQQKHLAPCYKGHMAVDDKAGVVIDAEVTTGEASEGNQLPAQLDRIAETLGHDLQTVTTDSGYGHAANYAHCEARGVQALIPPQRLGRRRRERLPARRFRYDAKHQIVRCPRRKILRLVRADERQRTFAARAQDCAQCPLRSRCCPPTAHCRVIILPVGYEALLRARRRQEQGYDQATRAMFGRHRWQVEGTHGEMKTQHGLRRAVRRGLDNVRIQFYLTAMAINLKRLAKHANKAA